jgi:predicted nucleic acid-binding protein
MNVIDSSGWLEYFTNGNNAGFFAPVIENTADVLVPTITLFEVFKRILMKECLVIDLDDSLALVAAELSHELKLPMADSIILATARMNAATLWTQDAHFKEIEDVKYREKEG